MPMKPTEKIWHNGKLINWDDAKIHVLSHVVSYASAVFEGLRCYETKNGPAIFAPYLSENRCSGASPKQIGSPKPKPPERAT